MEITLKNFKYHPDMSDDSNCFTATLVIDGKAVGFCEDDGNGGEVCIQPLGGSIEKAQANRRVIQAAEAWVRENIPGESYTLTLELPPASLVDPAISKAQYAEMGLQPGSTSTGVYPTTLESYVADMAEKLIHDIFIKKEEARYRRECKTKTLFNLPGDRDGNYHTYDRPFGPLMVEFMKGKHPDADIWNYKYGGVLSAADEQKQLDAIRDRDWKKKCKTKTLFRLDDGKVYESRNMYSYTIGMQLRLKYGDRLVEIINDRLNPLPSTEGFIPLYRLMYTETRIPAQWIVGPVYYVTPDDLINYNDIPNHVRYTQDFEEVKRLWDEDQKQRG